MLSGMGLILSPHPLPPSVASLMLFQERLNQLPQKVLGLVVSLPSKHTLFMVKRKFLGVFFLILKKLQQTPRKRLVSFVSIGVEILQ